MDLIFGMVINKRQLMLSGGDCNATPALRLQNYLRRRICMTFEIHSDITNRSMTIAARAMRKVLRRKRSILWAIFGWSVFLFNALLLIPFDGEPFVLDVRTVTSMLVEVMLLSVLLIQDRFNGMIASKTRWRAQRNSMSHTVRIPIPSSRRPPPPPSAMS